MACDAGQMVIDKVAENGEYLKETEVGKLVSEKASEAKDMALEKIQGGKVYAEEKVQQLVVFYDDASNYVGMLV